MDDLFKRPLWTMWRHAYPTEEEKTRQEVRDLLHEKEQHNSAVEEVESVEARRKGASLT